MTILLIGLWSGLAAASPYVLPYYGRLAEPDGKPVAGPVDLQAEFFRSQKGDDPVGPVPAPFKGVKLVDGTFQITVALSPEAFHDVFGDGSYDVYVEITDLTHKRVYPRQRLMAVPYAMRVAVDAKTLRYDDQGRLSIGPATAPASGQFLTKSAGGDLVWATPSATAGVAGVTAGTGLTGGGSSGTVTLSVGSLSGGMITSGTVDAARLPTASSSAKGALSAADWTTFNGKEGALAAGNGTQYYRGDKTWQTLNTTAVAEGANLYFTDQRAKDAAVDDQIVNGTTDVAPSQNAVYDALELRQLKTEKGALNGYAGLDGAGKVPTVQLPFSGLTYRGAWNAATNTPTLSDNCGGGYSAGQYLIVNVDGTTTIQGISTWGLGDWIVCSSTSVWQRIGTTVGGINSVNTKTGGAITLKTVDIEEDTNLYYTAGRATTDARAAISATGALGYTPATGVMTLGNASGSTTGALTSTDWNTFDGKVGNGTNVGAGGVATFKQKSGTDLQFRSVNAASSKVSVALDGANNEIDLDVNEANLSLGSIGGTLGVNKGGTGATTLTSNGVLLGNGTGTIGATAALTNGQLLIGSTGSAPSAASLTQGANQGVTIMGGAGSLALDTVQDLRTTAIPTFASVNLTGALNLPANGLVVGTNQLVTASGNIGIGTTNPSVSLDMAGRNDAMILPKGTTGQRPGSPVAGMLRFNTSSSSLEQYDGSWRSFTADRELQTITYDLPGTHNFTTSAGIDTFRVQVWGGGGGGKNSGSGGSGGGYAEASVTASAGTSYTVTVGAAGVGGASSNGGNSSFGTVAVATGGAKDGGAPGTGTTGDVTITGGDNDGTTGGNGANGGRGAADIGTCALNVAGVPGGGGAIDGGTGCAGARGQAAVSFYTKPLRNCVTYNVPGAQTFVVPAYADFVKVEAWGGGGGSKTSNDGGSGGGYAVGYINVTPGSSHTVTVGAGGEKGGSSSNGGSSSFGAFVVATGGAKEGGAGGTGTAGNARMTGEVGGATTGGRGARGGAGGSGIGIAGEAPGGGGGQNGEGAEGQVKVCF